MKEKLSVLIERAQNEIDNQFFEELDATLSEIWELGDYTCIHKIILLLDDEYEFDEVMFTLVHFVESYDLNLYVEQLLISLSDLYSKAEEWAETLLARVNNSSEAKLVLELELNKLNKNKRQELEEIINKMDL
jgi:hypothetical protein